MKKFEYRDEYQDLMDKTWHKMFVNLGEEGQELVSITPFRWQTDKSGFNVIEEYCYGLFLGLGMAGYNSTGKENHSSLFDFR